ncbi:ImmA/IrrE family metallo-endopeptidase [Weissella hellenica]|uniref:ImmA/IrrE family metallo-endopeptidase n=1 Tax=Weissella hellenica TaxID=46256 RepID=UPI003883D2E9
MARVEFSVNPEVLTWVISDSDLLPEKMDEQLQKFEVSGWLRGEKTPTLAQLKKFASALHVPFGHLFLKQVPKTQPVSLAFRTVENRPAQMSGGLKKVIGIMQTRQDWMRDELIEDGANPLEIIGEYKDESSYQKLAEEVRNLLELNQIEGIRDTATFFNNLKLKVTQKGILVMMDGTVGGNTHRPLNTDEARAFVLIDDYAPLVFLNSKDALVAKIFSLVHEFVHILRGSDEVLAEERNTNEERFINKVVATALIPEKLLLETFSVENVETNARQFHVSVQTLVYRAKEIGLISQVQVMEILQNQPEVNAISGTGGSYWNTAISRVDVRFADAVMRSNEAGLTPTTEAVSLLGVSLKTFDGFKNRFFERYAR